MTFQKKLFLISKYLCCIFFCSCCGSDLNCALYYFSLSPKCDVTNAVQNHLTWQCPSDGHKLGKQIKVKQPAQRFRKPNEGSRLNVNPTSNTFVPQKAADPLSLLQSNCLLLSPMRRISLCSGFGVPKYWHQCLSDAALNCR